MVVEFEEITRKEWGAQEPKNKVELWSPVAKILIVYGTRTEPCTDTIQCMRLLQELQWSDMYARKLPDINYNFLIGGDGNVYEGRGFMSKTSLQSDYPPNSLVIGFIGDWAVEDPPEKFMEITDEFIKRYVGQGRINPNWKKFCIRGY